MFFCPEVSQINTFVTISFDRSVLQRLQLNNKKRIQYAITMQNVYMCNNKKQTISMIIDP